MMSSRSPSSDAQNRRALSVTSFCSPSASVCANCHAKHATRTKHTHLLVGLQAAVRPLLRPPSANYHGKHAS
eukprot:4084170-Pyramimonas_sp.AAC.1